MTNETKLDLTSHDLPADKTAELLRLFPEIHTEGGQIDFDKLKLALGQSVDVGRERYGMTWPGKGDCFKTIQTPSMGTLLPAPAESVDFETTENLIIEGDNLEALKLLQKAYLGKVKMIYIDPPYNTGNDFIYPDNYTESLQTYLEYTKQVDDEGKKFGTNSDTDGRFHSRWLNMMYPRLYLARNLLRDDGVIFISIDDGEVANLRKLCDEIFGEENLVANIIWEKKYSPQNDAKWLSDNHDHILLYAKNKEQWRPELLPRGDEQNARYQNPDNDPRGNWKSSDLSVKTYSESYDYPITTPIGKTVNPPAGRCWVVSKEKYQELVNDNRIWFGKDGSSAPSIKRFLFEVKQGMVSMTLWKREDVGDNQDARRAIRDLFDDIGIFDTPKPPALIQKMLQLSTKNNDESIVLDFFAGSGTTAHAILEMNNQDSGSRKFLLVQLPEPTNRNDFKTISDVTKERVRRVIKKMNEEEAGQLALNEKQDRGFRVFKLGESNFKAWDASAPKDAKSLEKQLELHIEHIREGRTSEDILYEILLKSGFALTTPVTPLQLPPTALAKGEGQGVKAYSVANGGMLICLEKDLTLEAIRAMAEMKPQRVVCLDLGFSGNDQLKTNAVQIFKNKEIVFKTV
jgi:adenine-specific DNA-methyltransferase